MAKEQNSTQASNQASALDIPSAKARYLQLDVRKKEVLRRGEEAAKVTIPSIFPAAGHSETAQLVKPYQSLGARAVNNLSSKITLALFPANTAFFKAGLDETIEVSDAVSSQITEAMAKLERAVTSSMEASKLRPVLTLMMKHLLVTGNGTVDIDAEGAPKFVSVRNYVVERDGSGNLLDFICKEALSPLAVPEAARHLLTDEDNKSVEKDVELYTRMQLLDGKYIVQQELNDQVVPGSEGDYPLDAPRFIVCRWSLTAGEDYGRGLVDEYIGDFSALDDLSRDLLKASAMAAKTVFTLKPGSAMRKKDLEEAECGDVLTGDNEDVGTIGLDKYGDFRITLEKVRDIEKGLEKAFLMNTSVQREAERVTAKEIGIMVQELEDAHSGVYSTLAVELQSPLVRRYIAIEERKGKIPILPKSDLKLTITTGLEALGRGHDLNKLVGYLRAMGEIVGPEILQQRIDFDNMSKRVAASYGVDVKDLWKSEEAVAQDTQSQNATGIATAAAPGAIKEMVKGAMNGQGQ